MARVVELTVTTAPLPEHVVAPEAVKLLDAGSVATLTVEVLFVPMADVQDPEARLVIVMVEFPATVKPVAVNVPVPAVLTVMDAVNPL